MKIGIVNLSSVDARPIVRAVQKQVFQHFAPPWGMGATVSLVKRERIPTKDAVIASNSSWLTG